MRVCVCVWVCLGECAFVSTTIRIYRISRAHQNCKWTFLQQNINGECPKWIIAVNAHNNVLYPCCAIGVGDNKRFFQLLKLLANICFVLAIHRHFFNFGSLSQEANSTRSEWKRKNLRTFCIFCNMVPTILFKRHFNKFPQIRSKMKWNNGFKWAPLNWNGLVVVHAFVRFFLSLFVLRICTKWKLEYESWFQLNNFFTFSPFLCLKSQKKNKPNMLKQDAFANQQIISSFFVLEH